MKIHKLTEKQEEEFFTEIDYNKSQMEADLEHVKEWLKTQHHLPPSRLKESDCFLKAFLTGCKGSLEKVKRKLDEYYTFRSHSELFECRDPLNADYAMCKELVHFVPILDTTEKIPIRFMFAKLADLNQENFDFLSYQRQYLNIAELWMRKSEHTVRIKVVADFTGVTVNNHLTKVKPLLIKDMLHFLLDILPLRIAKIYFINVPPFVTVTINTLVVPFLSKKIRERLVVTANGFEEISEDFDKETVPKEYGGFLPSLKELSEKWYEEEKEMRDWYLNELSEKCDESKRIIDQDPTNPYFGVPGSLKKLIVD